MRKVLAALATTAMLVPGLVLGVGGAAGAADPVFPPTWDKGRSSGDDYVAMGDSFASGPGVAPQRPGGCARSEKNYATLLATALDVNVFTDASCGGAQTVDLAGVQGSNPPQYDALGLDTTLVTLGTIGGNDVKLVQLATECVLGDCAGTPGDALHRDIDALGDTFVDVVAEVRTRAPNADIVVVGYGTYVPPTSCASLGGVTPAEATYLQGVLDHLSDELEAAALAANDDRVVFADMRDIPKAAAHTACAAPDEQWVRAMNTYGDGVQLHPSTRGMANWGQWLTGQVKTLRGETPDPWVEITDGPTAPVTTPPNPEPVLSGAQRLAVAEKTLRFHASCVGAVKASKRRVRLRVTGGDGLARAVEFRVGRARVARDRSAPFVRTVKTRAVLKKKRARHGRVRAEVTLRLGSSTATRTVSVKRPACLKS